MKTRRLHHWTLVAALALACGGGSRTDDNSAQREDCQAAVDHLVELSLASSREGTTNPAHRGELEKHRKPMREALSGMVGECVSRGSSKYVSCLSDATSVSEARDCQ